MAVSRRVERLATVGTFVAVIAIWYAGAWLVKRSGSSLADAKLPYPHLIVQRIVTDHSTLLSSTWTTVSEALLGFVVGGMIACLLSIVMSQAGWLESALMPYVLAAQMIPLISLVPIADTVFKSDSLTRLFIAGFITFFSVTVAFIRGLKAAPRPAYELMASYNAGRLKRMRFLELPAAVPMLFSGLRVAAPLSLVGSVVVDLMGAQTGLGYIMLSALTFGPQHATLLWAAMLITLALGFVMSQAVVLAERVLAPWQPSLREEMA